MGYPIPPDNVVATSTGHAVAHDQLSDGMRAVLGPNPSGDTTGATDTAAVQALLSAASLVTLQPGIYYANVPWLMQVSGQVLRGAKGSTTSVYDGIPPTTGTVIKAASGWSANSVSTPAALQAQADGVHVRDLWIDATNVSSNVDGFNDGAGHKAIGLRNVGVYQPTQRCFAQAGSAWHLFECSAIIPGGTGFYGNWTDSICINCHAQGCGQSGTGIGFYCNGSEAKFIGCRADLSQYGFQLDAGEIGATFADIIQLVGCSTQRNNKDGYLITNSSGTGQSGRVPVILSGCVSDGDGVNGTLTTTSGGSITGGAGGGSYAGIRCEGNVTAIIDGHVVSAATRDTSGTPAPQYGLITATKGSGPGKPGLVTIANSLLNANTAAINDAAPAQLMSVGAGVYGYTGGVYLGSSGTVPVVVTPNYPGAILACTQYAPGTQQSKTLGTSGILTFAAFDTTNLTTAAVTVPPSGKVKVTVSLNIQTNTASDKIFLNLGNHSSVTPVSSSWECTDGTAGVARMYVAEFLITGLTPGASAQWDLLGAGTTGTIITILAFAQSSATPTQSGGSPVTFTVQAL